MTTEQDGNVAAANDIDPAVNEPVLNPEPDAEGAPATGDGTGESSSDAQDGKEDTPILNPEAGNEGGEEKNEFVGAPESYGDFTLPDGFAIDDEGKSQITELFKGLNLSQKGGQKLVDIFTERMIAQKEAELNALTEQRKQWRASIRQRPNYAAERALAQKGMNAVVKDPEGVKLFKDSWMSDHPALFNVFVEVGRMVGEDSPLPNGSPESSGETAVSRFPIKLN